MENSLLSIPVPENTVRSLLFRVSEVLPANRLGIWQLFKVPVQGGEPIQVTKKGGFAAFESHDGSALYYWKDNDYGIWKMPLPDGDEARIVPVGLDWGRWALSENG